MTCDEYLKLFRAQVDTINAHGGRARFHWGTYLSKLNTILGRDGLGEHPSRDEMENAQQEASNLACTKYLSCMFICAVDQTRFRGLKTALDNPT